MVTNAEARAEFMNRLPHSHPSEIADDVSRPKQENTRPSPKQLACEVLQGRASVVEDEIFLDGKPATLADLVRAAAQRGVAIHYPGIFPIPEAYRTGPSLLGAMRRSGVGRLGRRLGAGGRRSPGPRMPFHRAQQRRAEIRESRTSTVDACDALEKEILQPSPGARLVTEARMVGRGRAAGAGSTATDATLPSERMGKQMKEDRRWVRTPL